MLIYYKTMFDRCSLLLNKFNHKQKKKNRKYLDSIFRPHRHYLADSYKHCTFLFTDVANVAGTGQNVHAPITLKNHVSMFFCRNIM